MIPEHLLNSLKNRLMSGFVFEPNTGCWLWFKANHSSGHGVLGYGKKLIAAHRASYFIHKGNIPNDLIVRHKCDTPACINPDHLELGTHFDNMQDMVKRRRHKTHKTNKCKNGHEFTSENTSFVYNSRIKRPQKVCKICKKIRQNKYLDKKGRKSKYVKPFKDFCKYGHDFSGDNVTYRKNGDRLCVQCQKRRVIRKKERRKELREMGIKPK